MFEQENMFPHYTGQPIVSIGNTSVTYVTSRDILTQATGFIGDGYDYTLNPFVGCQFKCGYCYAAGFARTDYEKENWGLWVRVKENAIYKMHKHARIDGKRVYMSSVTDPYQPVEQKLGLVRSILEVLATRGDKVKLVVQTRSPLVTRDTDVMETIIANGGEVQVNMTITTDDEDVRRKIEPNCPSTPARLRAIQHIAQHTTIRTAVTMSPLLYVKDHETLGKTLADSGLDMVIAQSLHAEDNRTPRKTPKATTWERAIQPMAEIMSCTLSQVMRKHQDQYKQDIELLSEHLPNIKQGRAGFLPPF